MIYNLLFSLLLPVFLLAAPSPATDFKTFTPIGASEFTLNNGMKVVLKPTDFDEGEIFVRIAAKKGYVNLPAPLRPSARTLQDFIWESGIGKYTGDTLSVFLFENGLELNFGIGPAERYIEGEGRADRTRQLLQLIHDLFVLTRVDRNAMPIAKEHVAESIERTGCDSGCVFEAAFKKINTDGFPPLAPLQKSDMESVNYDSLQKVLIETYQDPSEFVAVIVGDFEVKQMTEWVEKTLGTIPSTRRAAQWNEVDTPKFPSGIVVEAVRLPGSNENLTRISFPITATINQNNIVVLDVMIETIEVWLRDVIKRRYGKYYGIDVSYEFPLYPSLVEPWLMIQFRSDNVMTGKLTTLVMNQLAVLKGKGPSDEDIEAAKLQKARSDEYWMQNNRFWLSALMHYHLSGWDPSLIQYNYSTRGVDSDAVREAIKTYFPLDNYTIVTGEM